MMANVNVVVALLYAWSSLSLAAASAVSAFLHLTTLSNTNHHSPIARTKLQSSSSLLLSTTRLDYSSEDDGQQQHQRRRMGGGWRYRGPIYQPRRNNDSETTTDKSADDDDDMEFVNFYMTMLVSSVRLIVWMSLFQALQEILAARDEAPWPKKFDKKSSSISRRGLSFFLAAGLDSKATPPGVMHGSTRARHLGRIARHKMNAHCSHCFTFT
jgi:hypothetical protein